MYVLSYTPICPQPGGPRGERVSSLSRPDNFAYRKDYRRSRPDEFICRRSRPDKLICRRSRARQIYLLSSLSHRTNSPIWTPEYVLYRSLEKTTEW